MWQDFVGRGLERGEKEASEKQPCLRVAQKQNSLLKTVQSLPSKVRKTEEKIWSLKEVIVSSVPFSVFVELVWWWVSWAD